MNKIKLTTIWLLLLFLGFDSDVNSQEVNTSKVDLDQIQNQIIAHLVEVGINPELSSVKITSWHQSDHNEVIHVYFQQVFNGLEIHKAFGNLAISYAGKKFKISRLEKDVTKFSDQEIVLTPEFALKNAAEHLKLPFASARGRFVKQEGEVIEIQNLPYADGSVFLKRAFAKADDGSYYKSWHIEFGSAVSADHWELVVNGSTGELMDEINHTVYCNFDHQHNPILKARDSNTHAQTKSLKKSGVDDGSKYRVFAPPLESPAIGPRTLEENPADELASPFGWHDTDGVAGPEFTILRGNNVHAYQDTADANIPGEVEPQSTVGLEFDFTFERDSNAIFNLDADLTNLFYWNNFMHDWSYRFGFNEESGNFQANNYGKRGGDDDFVFAESLDGSGDNNANFSAPRDGANGRMQMFRWILGGDFEVLAPSNVAGAYSTGVALFGPESLRNPIDAELVYVQDDAGDIRDGCDNIVNGDDIAGKIALIDRKDCDFSFKVHNAQEEGAIACIICNNNPGEGLVNMSGGQNATLVTIPSAFLSKEDCDKLKRELDNGLRGRFNEVRELSSSFDNGIVSHEYTHGISLRLVGGATTSGCLNNDEQMGEGWSDFFGIVTTQLPDDTKK